MTLAACGGESSRRVDGGVGGASAPGGSSASGGTGVGGTAGRGGSDAVGGAAPIGGSGGGPAAGGTTAVGCPSVAPGAYAASCPPNLPADGCRYELECHSGPAAFTYRCSSSGWALDERECDREFDACDGGDAQVQCSVGQWTLLGAGGDEPLPCPAERPISGSACSLSSPSGFPPFCGYPCDDGSGWTVRTCTGASWIFDSACQPDCSDFDRALDEYVEASSACETDADCHTASSTCSRFICDDVYALGPSGDDAVLEKLVAEVRSCSETVDSPRNCDICYDMPPPPRCDSGSCVFVW